MNIVGSDPDVETFYEYGGGAAGNQFNTGSMFAPLRGHGRPQGHRRRDCPASCALVSPRVPAFLPSCSTSQQDVNIGARQGGAQYQYTLAFRRPSSALHTPGAALSGFCCPSCPSFLDRRHERLPGPRPRHPYVTWTATWQREASASRPVKWTPRSTTPAGQRIVSTLYEPLNQYYVVLTLAPEFTQRPGRAKKPRSCLRKRASVGPLRSLRAHWETRHAPLAGESPGSRVRGGHLLLQSRRRCRPWSEPLQYHRTPCARPIRKGPCGAPSRTACRPSWPPWTASQRGFILIFVQRSYPSCSAFSTRACSIR